MEVVLLKESLLDTQLFCLGAHVAQGRLGRFLHHAPQLPGECKLLPAGHLRRLHKEDIAPCLGPGKAGGHPGTGGAHGHLGEVALGPEVIAEGGG